MIEENKLIAEFMNVKFDYSKCDNCGKINPITFAYSSLTKCCSTSKDKLGNWHYPKLAFYSPPGLSGVVSSIGKISTIGCLKSENLKYHSSWDWLMPVVKKIENLGYNTLISDFQIQISFNGLDCAQKNIVNIFNDEDSTKLKEVYKAVVEFIKWYNNQK